ncbi:hypothetical protein TTHERM_00277140 (macronuclear) [Tetrahymena thermophila SB210]|uniref:Uncharacterized protein n=1 Tax=Tetrahymena thermophila (strain SB210) TaxID=312017 RepID=I7MK81_TETTS|nr:hypothetical protein TTHERM_00277140 [Tetrahymena thermophila SB210]EAR97829.2 hypothetical protein TTHERM_00277140 [Tetrahymena thermophila SB210]|eukprot:XP_001018074.2 hypothetical protein TTHERM_00277140 [Tetrahymena thermophila SB210]
MSVNIFQQTVEEIILRILEPNNDNRIQSNQYFQEKGGIIQVKVYDQYTNSLCGFHSLFNAFYMIDYLTKDKNEQSLVSINQPANFWRFYYSTYRFLLDQYPNKQDLKYLDNLGPLERSHLEFFIEKSELVLEKKHQCSQKNMDLILFPFYYGFGIVQLSEDQVDQFNQIVNLFNQSQKDTLVIVFTGTTNHWITYIAYKDFFKNEKKFYFLDSANLSLNDLLDENIDALLLEIETKQKNRGVEEKTDSRESSLHTTITSLKDRKTVLNLLNNCFLEKVRLEVCMIENQFKEMFVTFTEYFPNWREQLEIPLVNEPSQKLENQLKIEILVTFIKYEYRPQVIEHDILKVMKKYSHDFYKYFDKDFGKLIIQWIDLNQITLQNIKNEIKEDQEIVNMIDKYICVIQEIKILLQQFC